MSCERCGKRLSRKSARQIGGVVMCSPCMFATPKPRNAFGGNAFARNAFGMTPDQRDA